MMILLRLDFIVFNFNLFLPNDYKKNDKIICKYFKDKYVQPSSLD